MKFVPQWRRFVALPPRKRGLLARAWLALARARLELALAPFALVRLRPRVAPTQRADAGSVAWAIRAAARFIPRATCLVQALAAHRLLARLGHDALLNIGVAKPPRGIPGSEPAVREAWSYHFGAHAWVEYRGAVLVGGSETQYTPLVQWSGVQ